VHKVLTRTTYIDRHRFNTKYWKCKVHGAENLYVVDASVFSTIPSAVPNLSIMMLGERIADWLKSSRH
jgi:site-specific DNA recombinase